MKKALAFLLCIVLLTGTCLGDQLPDAAQKVRIGLNYGSAAVGFNIFYAGGFTVGGVGPDREFTPIYELGGRYLALIEDENLYFNGTQVSTSGDIAIGAYHICYDVEAEDGEALSDLIEELKDAGISEVFGAWDDGVLTVRSGSYQTKQQAEQQLETAQKRSGYDCRVDGGFSDGYTLVDLNDSATILFEYRDSDGNYPGVAAMDSENKGWEDPGCALKNGTSYYMGVLCVCHNSAGGLNLINVLDVENYIKGIVPYEMSPSWPLEALKAQAVCARNYAYQNLNKHSSQGFDLCSGVHCQAYGGTALMCALTNRAVEETAGQVLCYDGELAELYYHSSSGGMTENVENIWVKAIPYLVAVDTPYEHLEELKNGYYSYAVTYDELTELLQSKGCDVDQVVDIYVEKYTEAGNVYSVIVVDKDGSTIRLEKENCRLKLSPYVRSQRFDILKDDRFWMGEDQVSTLTSGRLYTIDGQGKIGCLSSIKGAAVLTGDGLAGVDLEEGNQNSVTFSGAGLGNNVGMSQYSAKGMAEEGWTFDKILAHFFPGTKLEELD